MPNIKSAKKRVKVNRAKRMNNQMVKSALKTSIKRYEASLSEAGSPSEESAFRAVVKDIDRAVAKGVLHKNSASRKKSALAHRHNAARQENA